jgi:prevent-host-death family protein
MTIATNKTSSKRASAARHPDAWPVTAAKARLSEVIDQVLLLGPQTINRDGRGGAVLVSVEE